MHSLEIATPQHLIALLLGTPLALALARHRFRGRAATDPVIFTDIAAPSVVVGRLPLGFFLTLNVPRGLLTILIAHVAFNVAFVTSSSGRGAGLDRRSTGGRRPRREPVDRVLQGHVPADPARDRRRRAARLRDVDRRLHHHQFVAGQTVTFPLWVYGAVKVGIPPQVFVMGTLIFAAGIMLALANMILQRRGRVARA